jgi:hypothetical protein
MEKWVSFNRGALHAIQTKLENYSVIADYLPFSKIARFMNAG